MENRKFVMAGRKKIDVTQTNLNLKNISTSLKGTEKTSF